MSGLTRSRESRRSGMDVAEYFTGISANGSQHQPVKEVTMLQAAAVFFIIAIIAAIFGFGGIAAGATEIAKILFFIFLIVFIVSLIMGLMRR
jgi:uncharacterized membrane protein YtjA (UPF0391 family)